MKSMPRPERVPAMRLAVCRAATASVAMAATVMAVPSPNALSVLRMVSALPTSTNATVAWQSVVGVNYFLERSTNLTSPFSLLATNITGQAGTTSYADTNAAGAGRFFYRVGVQAP